MAPGIEFRLFELKDAEPVFVVVDGTRAYLREWLPWVDLTESVDDLRRFIGKVREQFAAGRGPQCVILVDGAVAGSIGCHPIDWRNRSCSIGYWIDQRFQGKGVITRCCENMLDYLFDELELHRVSIHCGVANTRSCAIPERMGFTREGLLRDGEWVNDHWLDIVAWGMLDRDWRARRTAR
ncbi:MAG: GNAT family protein [Candidatus Solibacter sp.]